jgi:maleylacetate reductase
MSLRTLVQKHGGWGYDRHDLRELFYMVCRHASFRKSNMTLGKDEFVYIGLPARVIFGFGTRTRVPDELARLGVNRPILLATSRTRAEALRAELGVEMAGTFAEAAMHTPVHVTERALAAVVAARADGLVALGGGSATGLAKAIALRTDLPQLILPTTYSGSEMTPVLGETSDGRKKSQRSPKVLPETVIYDVELTLTLPPRVSVTSGMNAIAHIVEGLYAQDRNPITSLMSLEAFRALARGLPVIVNDPQNRAARADALYGAWLCSTVLGSVGMALHHKICHVLGGTFDLPHAETHTVILPHAASFNARAVADLLAPVAEILHSAGPGQGLFDLAKKLQAPVSLKEIGMAYDGLDKAADQVMESPYYNPRQPSREEVRALLDDAFHGRRPER